MTVADTPSAMDIQGQAARIAAEVAGPQAAEVDRLAVFPTAAIAALREAGLLAMMVPTDLGGAGAGLEEVARVVETLGRHCSATALIFAMHQIQVACLVEHGRNSTLRDLLRDGAEHGLLLGSSTSERGTDGDIRTSRCAVEREDGDVTVDKEAAVISYGREADAILVTARRSPTSASGDQVLLACRQANLKLSPLGGSEMLGLRGTRSLPYRLTGRAPADAIFPDPFDEILASTMLPVSHILWASVWLGLADAAMAQAARFVQSAARRSGEVPVSAGRLASLSATHQAMRALIDNAIRLVNQTAAADRLAPDFAVQVSNLKVLASSMVVDIVSGALMVIGTAGYRDEGEYALGRLLRDAYGGLVMISNDRVVAGTARQLLAVRSRS